jgi:FkbM family methyltransferase
MANNEGHGQPSVSSTTCRYGNLSYFTNDGPIGDSLREYGEWAQVEIDFLSAFAPGGSTVIDVGAFIGTHALAFSDAVGPEGRVFALEPQPEAFQLLSTNVGRNSATNITVLNVAAGARAGDTTIDLFPHDRRFNGGSSRTSDSGGTTTVGISVQAIDELPLDSCALVKIDVEGAESVVLDGLTDVIHKFRPVIFCELNDVSGFHGIMNAPALAGWAFYLVRSSAFNPRNIYGNRINFFGDARETGVLITAPDVVVEEKLGLHLDVIRFDGIAALEVLLNETPRFGVELEAEIELERLRSRVAALSTEVDGLRFANASLYKSVRDATELASTVRAEYESSRSWKLTRVLRTAGNVARKVLRRLGR